MLGDLRSALLFLFAVFCVGFALGFFL